MKIIIPTLLLAIISSNSYAYNKGLICITYLSRDGSLNITDRNKFTESDLDELINYTEKKFNVKNLGKIIGEPDVFARGLAKDKNTYPIILVVQEDLYFQNGIFYIPRSQDGVRGMMEQFSSVIGGKVNEKCISANE